MLRSLNFAPDFLLTIRKSSSSSGASRIREIIRLALNEPAAAFADYETFSATNDVPDWGLIKFASVLIAHPSNASSLSSAEKLLRDHYEETGGNNRVARKSGVEDDQIEAALLRVLNADVERARKFYRLLLEMRFSSNKDMFISLFVRRRLQCDGVASAVDELTEWTAVSKTKSLTQSFLVLIEACSNKHETDLVSQLVRKHVPERTADLLFGFILLCHGRGSEFAEQLHRQNISIGLDGVRFICQLAGKSKKASALQSLLTWNILLKIDEKAKSLVFEELIKIYGKKDDISMDALLIEISKEKNCLEHFDKPIQVARHFYKCLNRPFPDELFEQREKPRKKRQTVESS